MQLNIQILTDDGVLMYQATAPSLFDFFEKRWPHGAGPTDGSQCLHGFKFIPDCSQVPAEENHHGQ